MILKKGKELCFLMELFDKAIRKIKAKRKYQEALEFQRKGLYKEAEAAYRGVIELNPSFYKAYTNLGSVLFKNRKFQDPDCDKKFSEAVQCYEKALEIQPDDPISLFNLGTIHYENFDNEERAFDYFAQAINADPRSVQKIQQYLGWISYNSKEDFKKVVDRSMYLVTQKKIQESAAISQVKPDSRKEQKPVITSKNINPISLVTSIILTSLIMGVSWISDARSISTEP
jgi:tetratricopeptide (TPR) repeat protein